MKPAGVVLSCTVCGQATVEGLIDPVAPGLAVTRMHAHNGRGELMLLPAWVVTHTGSGVVVGAGYERRDQAEAALLLLGGLDVDWRQPPSRLRHPHLVAAIRACVEAAEGIDTGL